jgi:hypothetical protein
MSLVLALALMALVVVPLGAWVVRADRRRRLESGESPRTGMEEVA